MTRHARAVLILLLAFTGAAAPARAQIGATGTSAVSRVAARLETEIRRAMIGCGETHHQEAGRLDSVNTVGAHMELTPFAGVSFR